MWLAQQTMRLGVNSTPSTSPKPYRTVQKYLANNTKNNNMILTYKRIKQEQFYFLKFIINGGYMLFKTCFSGLYHDFCYIDAVVKFAETLFQ